MDNQSDYRRVIFSAMSKRNFFLVITSYSIHYTKLYDDSPTIQTIAATQKTPKQIYDYVVNTLSYNYDKINRAQRMGDLAIRNNFV